MTTSFPVYRKKTYTHMILNLRSGKRVGIENCPQYIIDQVKEALSRGNGSIGQMVVDLEKAWENQA